MSFKRTFARKLVGLTDAWNREIHQAIEEKVIAEFLLLFPPQANDDQNWKQQRINDMRAFYYARMSNTASLLVACAALVVALVALVATLIPLFQ